MAITLDEMLGTKELLNFAINYPIKRNYLGDSLFPDRKTKFMKAEFYRLMQATELPVMAMVHALDSEAAIGERPTIEKVALEKMLIKEKFNMTETIKKQLDNGVSDNAAVAGYVFDDVGRLIEGVKTRTEVMKMDLLQSGKVTVKENKLNITVDYQIPDEQKFAFNWTDPNYNILADIKKMIDEANNNGRILSTIVTSTAILNLMMRNVGINHLINGNANAGMFVSGAQVQGLLNSLFPGNNIRIVVNDQKYAYKKSATAYGMARYINEYKFIGIALQPTTNTVGVGLWGNTPEEDQLADMMTGEGDLYVAITRWKEPDPVATWVKGSGMFIPVLPDKYSLYIADITAKGLITTTEIKEISRS